MAKENQHPFETNPPRARRYTRQIAGMTAMTTAKPTDSPCVNTQGGGKAAMADAYYGRECVDVKNSVYIAESHSNGKKG